MGESVAREDEGEEAMSWERKGISSLLIGLGLGWA